MYYITKKKIPPKKGKKHKQTHKNPPKTHHQKAPNQPTNQPTTKQKNPKQKNPHTLGKCVIFHLLYMEAIDSYTLRIFYLFHFKKPLSSDTSLEGRSANLFPLGQPLCSTSLKETKDKPGLEVGVRNLENAFLWA